LEVTVSGSAFQVSDCGHENRRGDSRIALLWLLSLSPLRERAGVRGTFPPASEIIFPELRPSQKPLDFSPIFLYYFFIDTHTHTHTDTAFYFRHLRHFSAF
jgi:hypothetical protein